MSEAVLVPESERPTEGGVELEHFALPDPTQFAAEAHALTAEAERHVQAHVIPPTWTVKELLGSEGMGPAFFPTSALAESWLDRADRPGGILFAAFLARGTAMRERPTFFALVDELRETLSLPVEQIVQLAGARRRTYYNWRNRGRAPDLARRKLARAGEWLDRLARLAPHLDLKVEADPRETDTLGGLLVGGAADTALAARLAELVSPAPAEPIRAHVVATALPEQKHDPDELLTPDQILAIAAAAPTGPRRRRAGTGEWTPRELTDSLADGS